MRIELNNVIVENQEQALRFYTDMLGFQVKMDIPAGEFRWLTVVSPDEPDGTELLLEPNANEAEATYQRALFEQSIPLTSFAVDDIEAEHTRLKSLSVKFTTQPTDVGGAVVAVVDDTCGNLIQKYQT
jgi:catechol 2,3-dioxygenase-like lactoylglutathione lyase family enzyme